MSPELRAGTMGQGVSCYPWSQTQSKACYFPERQPSPLRRLWFDPSFKPVIRRRHTAFALIWKLHFSCFFYLLSWLLLEWFFLSPRLVPHFGHGQSRCQTLCVVCYWQSTQVLRNIWFCSGLFHWLLMQNTCVDMNWTEITSGHRFCPCRDDVTRLCVITERLRKLTQSQCFFSKILITTLLICQYLLNGTFLGAKHCWALSKHWFLFLTHPCCRYDCAQFTDVATEVQRG